MIGKVVSVSKLFFHNVFQCRELTRRQYCFVRQKVQLNRFCTQELAHLIFAFFDMALFPFGTVYNSRRLIPVL